MALRVSVQQAACNAFATWLASNLTDVVVEPRWPAADKAKPHKSITIITAGPRRDTELDFQVVKTTNIGPTDVKAVWIQAACTQPLQLDVWAQTDVDRDDILARLDDLLDAGATPILSSFYTDPVGPGVLIAVQDGWEDNGVIADFNFSNPDCETTNDTTGRALYRATYSGEAYFMLTMTTTTARQALINFKLKIDADDFGTYSAP